MTNGDSAIFLQKQHSSRFAYVMAPSNDYTAFTFDGMTAAFDQFQYTSRGAGQKSLLTCMQQAYIQRMETVHIFFRVYGQNDFFLINLRRQRQLYQHPMDAIVHIQLFHQCQQIFFFRILRQFIGTGQDTHFFTSLFLIIYIYHGSGIVAHQNHSKAGGNPLPL